MPGFQLPATFQVKLMPTSAIPLSIKKKLILHWTPVAVFMALIFIGSTDLLSGQSTGRFLIPLIKFFLPVADDSTVSMIRFLIRKAGHVTEYAVLTALIWQAMTFGRASAPARLWEPKRAFLAWTLSTAYAASDEFHQSFVPSRGASPVDVLIDSAGALLALVVIFLVCRYLPKKWQNRQERVGTVQ
jgi:VanZ family protein